MRCYSGLRYIASCPTVLALTMPVPRIFRSEQSLVDWRGKGLAASARMAGSDSEVAIELREPRILSRRAPSTASSSIDRRMLALLAQVPQRRAALQVK